MNNYRVEYAMGLEVDYWNKARPGDDKLTFRNLPDVQWPYLSKIYAEADRIGIKEIWHFYEPYVEITWLSDNVEGSEELIKFIETTVGFYGDLVIRRPADGIFADWYCTNEREREFGAKRHALCAQWIRLYNEYKSDVDAGHGLDKQIARTIHTLSNPLGLNFKDEGKIGLGRFLAGYMPFWIPRKIRMTIYNWLLS